MHHRAVFIPIPYFGYPYHCSVCIHSEYGSKPLFVLFSIYHFPKQTISYSIWNQKFNGLKSMKVDVHCMTVVGNNIQY